MKNQKRSERKQPEDTIHARRLILHSAFFLLPCSKRRFLARAFRAGGDFMFPRFVFALAFADLLLDLFFHQINRRIEIALAVFGEQVRASHGQAYRTAELPLRNPHMIVLERDASMQDARIQAIQFVELREHVLLNGIRQRYVVRGEDQLHIDNMQSPTSIFNRQFPDRVLTTDDTD
jgi:hypothetical protein